MDYFDFFETCTGTFTEPIFFGERLALNEVFAEEAHTFDIFHDNQSLSNYPKIINKRLVTTLHHPIHVGPYFFMIPHNTRNISQSTLEKIGNMVYHTKLMCDDRDDF